MAIKKDTLDQLLAITHPHFWAEVSRLQARVSRIV